MTWYNHQYDPSHGPCVVNTPYFYYDPVHKQHMVSEWLWEIEEYIWYDVPGPKCVIDFRAPYFPYFHSPVFHDLRTPPKPVILLPPGWRKPLRGNKGRLLLEAPPPQVMSTDKVRNAPAAPFMRQSTDMFNKTTNPGKIGKFCVEIWANIFKYMEPDDNTYTRKYVINALHRSMPGFRGSGGSDIVDEFGRLIPHIPAFERAALRAYRRYYTINRNSRAAALQVGLAVKLLQLAKDPLPTLTMGEFPKTVDDYAVDPTGRPQVLVWQLFDWRFVLDVHMIRRDNKKNGFDFEYITGDEYFRFWPGDHLHRTMREILQEAVYRLEEDPMMLLGVKKVVILASVPPPLPNMYVPVGEMVPAFEAAWRKIGGSGQVVAYD